MNKTIIGLLALFTIPCALVLWLHAAGGEVGDVAALKRKAYDLYERGQFEQSAELFHGYLSAQPGDLKVISDYANLLDRLNRNAESAEMLETYHRLDPKNERAYFDLGAQYVKLQRNEQAAKIFAELAQSANPAIVNSAAEAAKLLQADLDRAARAKAEQKVYDLAEQFKPDEVIAAVDQMEKAGEVSFAMAMQRIYAYSNQQKYVPALELAESLAVNNPKATDLMIVRAELLFQLGRKSEAMVLWEQVARENSGSEAAQTAEKRISEVKAQEAAASSLAAEAAKKAVRAAQTAGAGASTDVPSEEAVIYNLAEKRQHREVVAAIDVLEKKRGNLDWSMKMQRLYALLAVGDTPRAAQESGKMAVEKPDSVELAMLRGDILVHEHCWQEASRIFMDVRAKNPNTPVAREVDRRLAEIPARENLDKWNWGESFNSGDYHSRFDSVIGYGYIRTGTYVPGARWLQPYVSFNYVVDTKSGVGPGLTIISDNSIGVYGGFRVQLFPTEYLFLYVQGGGNQDLLSERSNGDWRGDFMAGIYGYKAWGPGVNWKQLSMTSNADGVEVGSCSVNPVWRGDWWVDAGADFSYYDRFDSWLGYGQVREGLRLMQFGNSVAMDAYVMQNLAWDAKGNYTDNLFEIGPGLRFVWVPCPNWQVVLRTEWAEGYYLGRDDTHQKGTIADSYDDFRAGLSVGVSW